MTDINYSLHGRHDIAEIPAKVCVKHQSMNQSLHDEHTLETRSTSKYQKINISAYLKSLHWRYCQESVGQFTSIVETSGNAARK